MAKVKAIAGVVCAVAALAGGIGTVAVKLAAAEAPIATSPILTPAAKDEKPRLNPKLAALADNTWVNLGLPWRGGGEAGPFTYDSKHRFIFKYGGCGDVLSWYAGVDYAAKGWTKNDFYSNGCWGLDPAAGQWKIIRPFDPAFPKDRPANGCSRGHCYDSKRGLLWMYGGAASHGGGGDLWSLWTYDAGADKFELAAPPPPPRKTSKTMLYDPFNDLIVFTSGNPTWVFHCDTRKWEGRSTPGAPGTGSYNAAAFDLESKKVVLPLAQPTGRKSKESKPDTRTTFWKPIRNEFVEHVFATWTYDAAANQWEKLDLKGEESPAPRFRHGVAYDALNKVVILVSGSTDTWGELGKKDQAFHDVWVLDLKARKWTEMKPAGEAPNNRAGDCRQFCYDPEQNAAVFQPPNGSVYAYRYKSAAAK